MSQKPGANDAQNKSESLILLGQNDDLALRSAINLWASATTDIGSHCCDDLLRAKRYAVSSFFAYSGKHPAEVKPLDVQNWRSTLEEKNYARATVYARISRLSSFYEWATRDPVLCQIIRRNPARLARPKRPRAYQTESTKALDDEQLAALIGVVREKSKVDIVGKRDYALLLFFVTTGMRRNEVLSLRGSDVELKTDCIIVRSRIKGGDYVSREVGDPSVRTALISYLAACDRSNALSTDRPLWTRHDPAGKPGAPLTGHAFAKNLKRYGHLAGLEHVHIHQTRHTFARMVAEETGSLTETQDALGHRNLATTRVYVQRISVKRDKHGRRIAARLNISPGSYDDR